MSLAKDFARTTLSSSRGFGVGTTMGRDLIRRLIPVAIRVWTYEFRRRAQRLVKRTKKSHGSKAYMRRFGKLRGLLVYQKLMRADRGLIRLSIPDLRSLVSLRAGTSDVSTFEEVFLDLEYSIPVEVDPKLIIDGGANIGLTSLYFANTYPD